MKQLICFVLLLSTIAASSQELPAYAIFNQKGKAINFGKMARQLEEADVILFGEQHNDAVLHWLQLQLTKAMGEKNELVLGAEMFESDDQVLMNEYLSGVITHKHFTIEGKMWDNYETDYKPLVEYARNNQLKFIATNIPRRYASLVNREGLESLEKLSAEAKNWIAPLPIEVDLSLPGYAWMIEAMGAHTKGDPANMARSQASKDATMAHFILKNLEEDTQFIHFHGTFHSNNFEGIYHYLNKANASLKIMTIASVTQASIDKIEEKNMPLANFIIVTPEDGPKSY